MGDMDVAAWNAENPLHPRAGDGRFSIAGMVAKLIENFGDLVAHDEIGERDHSLSDHGMISVHDSGHAVISRTDEGGVPATVASGLSHDHLSDLQQELEDSLVELGKGLPPGTHLEWSADDPDAATSPVTVGYGVTSTGHAYVSLTGADDEGDSFQLSREHADDLVTQIESIRDQQQRYADDKDSPFMVRPLAPGENLEQRKGFSSGSDWDVVAGLVSGPQGNRLRLGLAGNEDYPVKRWTGGRGPMVADLGPDEAAELSTVLREVELELDEYTDRLGEALDIEEEWDQTPAGQRLAELRADGWSLWSSDRGLNVERHTGDYARGDKKAEQAPPEIAAEYMALRDELTAALDYVGLVDEGDSFSSYEVETSWGTIRIDLLGNTLDYEEPAEARISIRPKGVDADTWDSDVVYQYSARADYGPKKIAAIRRLADSYVKASQQAGAELPKSAGSATDTPGAGRARALKRYWTRGKGLAKWVRSAHPWTALRRHLAEYIHDPDKLDRTTSQWFHDATGIWSGERKGKNLLGRG